MNSEPGFHFVFSRGQPDHKASTVTRGSQGKGYQVQRYVTFHYMTLYYITLYCMTLHYIVLHYFALCYIVLKHITVLHYIIIINSIYLALFKALKNHASIRKYDFLSCDQV